jgi:hypothetical protein
MTLRKWLREGWVHVLFLAILTGVMILVYYRGHRAGKEAATKAEDETEHVIIYDTVRHVEVVPRDSVVVRYVVRRLPVAEATIDLEERTSCDTLGCDSAEVYLPVTQLTYADSTYKVWISGYEPRLDSIEVYTRRELIRTETGSDSRWSIALTAGYGYGPAGAQPFVGVGLSYRLFTIGGRNR